MSEEITLSLLITDWLKLNKNKRWIYNPKSGCLEMRRPIPLEPKLPVRDNSVEHEISVFGGGGPMVTLLAADPDFFPKLGKALIHEEKWCHFCKILVLLIDILDFLWGEVINVTFNGVETVVKTCNRWVNRLLIRVLPPIRPQARL